MITNLLIVAKQIRIRVREREIDKEKGRERESERAREREREHRCLITIFRVTGFHEKCIDKMKFVIAGDELCFTN